jgi:hypothetical protein
LMKARMRMSAPQHGQTSGRVRNRRAMSTVHSLSTEARSPGAMGDRSWDWWGRSLTPLLPPGLGFCAGRICPHGERCGVAAAVN